MKFREKTLKPHYRALLKSSPAVKIQTLSKTAFNWISQTYVDFIILVLR